MSKKPMSNTDLEGFINNNSKDVEGKGNLWEGESPTAKRVGVSAYNIALNKYEKAIIDAAAAKEGAAASGFIRQSALKKAKTILGID